MCQIHFEKFKIGFHEIMIKSTFQELVTCRWMLCCVEYMTNPNPKGYKKLIFGLVGNVDVVGKISRVGDNGTSDCDVGICGQEPKRTVIGRWP